MTEGKSKVDSLNDSLYSRDYNAPADRRTHVSPGEESGMGKGWDSPELKDMVNERRKQDSWISPTKKIFIASVLFFIAAAILAAYVYLGGANFISSKNVDIQVTGPVSIPAGDPLVLTVTVINKNNADLEVATLFVQHPEGSRNADDTALPLSRVRAELGTVKAGGEATETFRSILYGQKGEIKSIKMTVEYTVKGSNATFVKEKVYEIAIGDTPVAIGITQPQSVTSGELFTTTLTLAANSSEVVKNAVVRAEYPYGFTLGESVPKASSGDNVWVLGDLAPGSKKTVVLKGSIVGENEEERTFRFYAGVGDPDNPTVLKVPLVSTSETISIARPLVGLSLMLNGENEEEYVAPGGQLMQATLRYVNNSSDKLSDAVVVVKLTGNALDRFSVTPHGGGFYDSGAGTITWRAPDVGRLAEVAPGQSGQLTFNFSSPASIPAGLRNPEIKLEASINGIAGGSENLRTSLIRTIKISSQVTLAGKTLYSKGPFPNSGPIPPKAEKETTYTVVLTLGNTQSDISGGKLTGKLGPNVKWMKAQTSAEKVSYDSVTNTVTWDVGDLVSGVGFSTAAREAAFQVVLTPSIGQIGSAPTLFGNIAFAGMDSFTERAVTISLGNLTTRISTDPSYVQGDETVVR